MVVDCREPTEDAMPDPDDHADVRVLPPLLFVGSILAGALLRWLLPFGFSAGGGARVALGVATIAAGLAAGAWTIVWMRRTHQDPDPRKPTPELILAGPFRWSRNPIYVGMALIQAGVGIALGNLWILLLLAPTLVILQRAVVAKEEAYLTGKFGDAYRGYCASVRRWL
jgi:protein-S-isoprenylcysteine O-methyltransferase Ste14